MASMSLLPPPFFLVSRLAARNDHVAERYCQLSISSSFLCCSIHFPTIFRSLRCILLVIGNITVPKQIPFLMFAVIQLFIEPRLL